MKVLNIQPSFYDGSLAIFNYCTQEVLKNLFISKSNITSYDEFEVLDFGEELSIVRITKESIDLDNIKNKQYVSELYKALSNDGVFAKIQGNNAFSYIEILSKYAHCNTDNVFKVYKDNFHDLEDEKKQDYEKDIVSLIPKLHCLSIENKQFKTGDENDNLKDYCDSDFYSYIYNDIFMFACYASATMYAIKFTENGFKVYGQNNDYGKELELSKDSDFDWDGTNFEDYYLKHLNENMLIFEFNGNETVSYNELISMFHNIISFVAKEEGLTRNANTKNDESIFFEDDNKIRIERY